MIPVIGAFVAPILDFFGGFITRWQERVNAEHLSAIKIKEAQTAAVIRQAETAQVAEIEWDKLAVGGMAGSWKDEWLTILFSIPLFLCFIPGAYRYVQEGFEALQRTPEWYQMSIGVIVASSFGYRRVVDFFKRK